MFPEVVVPGDAADLPEQVGTKPKFWYLEGDTGFLFKEGRPGTGEDWAEKVSSELCDLLGLPHARYEFAVWRGRSGVVSPSFVPKDGHLVHGNELLAKTVKGYPEARFYHVREHVLRLVLSIVKSPAIHPPPGWGPFAGVSSSLDVFIGYLMLDAWIANQDRHHENWALLVLPPAAVHLAPTYDHASSLGRNETDESRLDRLRTRDKARSVAAYVARARSAFYGSPGDTKPLTTLDCFQAARRSSPTAASAWLRRLRDVDSSRIAQIFERIPPSRISTFAGEFALEILRVNRDRLLETEEGTA